MKGQVSYLYDQCCVLHSWRPNRLQSSSSSFRCSSNISSTFRDKAFCRSSPTVPPQLQVLVLFILYSLHLCGSQHDDSCECYISASDISSALSVAGDGRESSNHLTSTNGHSALLKRKERWHRSFINHFVATKRKKKMVKLTLFLLQWDGRWQHTEQPSSVWKRHV